MKAKSPARAVTVSLMLFSLVACGGSAPPAASTAPSAPTEAAPADAGIAESAPAASADSGPASAPETAAQNEPVVTTPETGASGVTSVRTSGSDAPDECSKSAIPFEEKVRPLLNKCYQEGKKKNPELSGTVRVAVNVNTVGKVTSVKSSGTSELGDSVVQCMVKAVREAKFEGALCKSKTVIVSKTYGKK